VIQGLTISLAAALHPLARRKGRPAHEEATADRVVSLPPVSSREEPNPPGSPDTSLQ